MSDQANLLRDMMVRKAAEPMSAPGGSQRARTVAVTSGKGGVGKSNLALNLSIALAQSGQTVCLLDANLGLGNIDLLCGLNGYWNLSHVVTGARRLADVILQGPRDIHVVPGASGLIDVADCSPTTQHDLLRQMDELEKEHDFLVVDTGTGIHRPVRQFVLAADIILVVTTPEVTSVADAYATVKALSAAEPPAIDVVVNQAQSSQQGRMIVERLQQTARVFLKSRVGFAGAIPVDNQVPIAVQRRTPFLIGSPTSPASRAVNELSDRIQNLGGADVQVDGFLSRLWQEPPRKAA